MCSSQVLPPVALQNNRAQSRSAMNYYTSMAWPFATVTSLQFAPKSLTARISTSRSLLLLGWGVPLLKILRTLLLSLLRHIPWCCRGQVIGTLLAHLANVLFARECEVLSEALETGAPHVAAVDQEGVRSREVPLRGEWGHLGQQGQEVMNWLRGQGWRRVKVLRKVERRKGMCRGGRRASSCWRSLRRKIRGIRALKWAP
mmetsp:Transcript_23318/g.37549  ORF Transcript_23318/g.37549 Transcript_23318/m.37549 type:complete len:201 (+) Transcript_23318:82-684(+)